MILYFDSYITDVSLNPKFVDLNELLRSATPAYALSSKIDIAKYTLASYATYPWSHVLIRYELEDITRYDEFEKFVRELFPEAVILRTRSANQAEYKKSTAILDKWDDNWIWYAPNNDHPLIINDLSMIDKMLAEANSYTTDYDYISIPYSHYSEYVNLPRKCSPSFLMIGLDSKIITENESSIHFVKQDGDYCSVQIVNKKLFYHWFTSKELGENRIIRAEDTKKFISTTNQLLIVPKTEICAHFDGYSHTINAINEILPTQVPPLFIPKGFFNRSIKIAYGYDDYREGWVNINPAAPHYSFEVGMAGTDSKISLEEIPIFWKDRITEIDINKNSTIRNLTSSIIKNNNILNNPWKFGNRKINIGYVNFILRNIKFRLKNIRSIKY